MATDSDPRIELIKNKIIAHQDFPKPGILFRDIFPVLADPKSSTALHSILKDAVLNQSPDFDVIVGLESRGFLFGTPLASSTSKPFVPIRKKGKLPGKIKQVSYALEYGEDIFEAQSSAIKPGDKVVIIDDLLATGGTMKAACELIASMGGIVTLAIVCIELVDLKGRDKVNVPFHSIIEY